MNEEKPKKIIDIYQCELDKWIPLEYVGKVKYYGESFGVDSLTNLKTYSLVKDDTGMIKVVDDSDEDYIYSLSNPAPATWYSKGGIFKIVDDPYGTLRNLGMPFDDGTPDKCDTNR